MERVTTKEAAKLLNMLTAANFHSECSLLCSGQYDKLINKEGYPVWKRMQKKDREEYL